MQTRRKAAASKQPNAADPAVHLCIVALLRVISRQQWSGEEIPAEILVFLASLAKPDDLLSSFGKGGQRRLAEKALLDPEDEDDDQLDLDGGGHALRRLMRRRRSATSLLTTPTSSVLRATRSAAPLVIQNLAQTLLSQWESAEVVASTDWLETNVRILQRLFAFSEAEVATARLAFAFQCVKGQSETISNAVKEAFYCRSGRAQSMMKLAHAIGCPPQDLSDVFSSMAPLRTSGLLCNVAVTSYDLDDVLLLSELGQMFASEPFESEESVRQRILTPLVLESKQGLVFTHLETQRRDIDSLIDGAIQTGTAGVNVLLYGQPGTGKTEFAKKLARDLGVACYLSTNHKDLRSLDKSNPALVAKAKDRWYVPDPNKAQDLEKRREKTLLKEFETYKAFTGRKIKESRLEVLRAGFRAAWGNKDYGTIISVASKLPEETLQEDEKLLLWYDQALTRTEAGA